MMKTKKIFQLLIATMTFVSFLFVLTGEAQAQPEGLSENAGTVLEYLEAGDEEGLREFLAGLSEDDRVAVASEMATQLKDSQIREFFPVLFKVLTFIQPTNSMSALEAVVRASKGRHSVVKGALEGMIIGALEHPDVTAEGERVSAMNRTGATAAALVVGIAEDTDGIDAANVAFAVMQGGMAAVEVREEATSRARALAEAMSNAGIGAALERNQPGVARAMMLALAATRDIGVRRAAVTGVSEGGEAAGGAPAARMMRLVGRNLERVEPVGPTPIAPDIRDVPDFDEVSPH